MTPEQKRIKIAESRGWHHFIINDEWGPDRALKPGQQFEVNCCFTDLPDYLNSRDAMAEALAGLTQEQHIAFMRELCHGLTPTTYSDGWCIVRATPSQLAEAYGLTKGLWEE